MKPIEPIGNTLGKMEPKYNFSLNPYPDLRFSSCPDCGAKTGQRKIPLIIHVDPKNLILLNYTNRYCKTCNMLIGHKHEIEHHLTEAFSNINPNIIGSNYLVFGPVDKNVPDYPQASAILSSRCGMGGVRTAA
jgi:hypothetical protein